MAYATAAQFLDRYDARDVGDLVSDEGLQVSPIDLPGHVRLAAVLNDASGDIEAALLVGNRYTPDQLSGLTGNSASHLQRVTCEIAMAYLLGRRPSINSERIEAQEKLRELHLDRLRRGENVFNLDDQRNAGVAAIDGPTTLDYSRELNLIRDRTRHYFPARRLPHNR